MTQDEFAAKYHWRIKYPKTYEMAVRNYFLEGELPSEPVATEIVQQPDKSAIDLKTARQKRALNNLRSGANTLADLPVAELTKRRRRVQSRHTEWTGRPAEAGDLEIGAFLGEILDGLTRIETALATVAAKLELP